MQRNPLLLLHPWIWYGLAYLLRLPSTQEESPNPTLVFFDILNLSEPPDSPKKNKKETNYSTSSSRGEKPKEFTNAQII